MHWDQDRRPFSGDSTSSGSFNGGGNVAVALPAVLRQLKDNVLSILLNHLNTYFTSCDDLFFDLAKKAANNKEQNLYFDSMREVRIRKSDVINNFKREYDALFRDLGKPRSNIEETRSATMETLNLVANDEMEQNVAISGIVGKARATYQEELYHLTCRLDYLLQNHKVNETNNPLDPAQLCASFSRSLKPLDVEFTARIILLKQFDRVVVREFGHVYRLANELLIASGVLPKIRNSIINPNSESPSGNSGSLNGLEGGVAHDNSALEAALEGARAYEVVSSLLGALRSMGTPLPKDIRSLYRDLPMGPTVAGSDLQGFLSNQQTQFASGHAAPVDLRQLIFNGLVTMGQPGQPRSLEQADEDVINLVAMFFDFVLDDSSLPVPIQALVARLQIPVLKVALNDKSFFSNQSHAVRRFINEIAAVSIGWDESDKAAQDTLFELIERLVHKILNSFQGDVGLFEECLKDLKDFVGEEQKRSNLIEKRTSEAAQGKAKMDHARGQVQKLLWNRLHDAALPPFVWSLLVSDWQKLLIHTLLKFGQDCQEWVDAIQFVDDICWFCVRHSDEKSRQRMTRLKPLLMSRAEDGFRRLSIPADNTNQKLLQVSELLDALTEGVNLPPYQSITAQYLMELGQSENAGGKSWKEMTALERQQIKHQAITYEFLRKADDLRVGSWINYTAPDTGRTTRCKLAAKIEATDQLVFVNRFGFKLLEKSKRQFAQDMQQGQVRLLESGLLFDRAMVNIATSLKKISPPGRQAS